MIFRIVKIVEKGSMEEGRPKKLCDKFSDLSIILIGFVFFSSIFPRLSSFALTFTFTDSHPLTSGGLSGRSSKSED
jgi:hypothetical protein